MTKSEYGCEFRRKRNKTKFSNDLGLEIFLGEEVFEETPRGLTENLDRLKHN